MQQRLAIGQALTARPRVLLLDEPFGALDPGTRLAMHDFLTELRAESPMTVFMVTHDLEEGFKLGDRVLVFDKPRWDPHDPGAYGATITYDFDARDGGIPFQPRDAFDNIDGPSERPDAIDPIAAEPGAASIPLSKVKSAADPGGGGDATP